MLFSKMSLVRYKADIKRLKVIQVIIITGSSDMMLSPGGFNICGLYTALPHVAAWTLKWMLNHSYKHSKHYAMRGSFSLCKGVWWTNGIIKSTEYIFINDVTKYEYLLMTWCQLHLFVFMYVIVLCCLVDYKAAPRAKCHLLHYFVSLFCQAGNSIQKKTIGCKVKGHFCLFHFCHQNNPSSFSST